MKRLEESFAIDENLLTLAIIPSEAALVDEPGIGLIKGEVAWMLLKEWVKGVTMTLAFLQNG